MSQRLYFMGRVHPRPKCPVTEAEQFSRYDDFTREELARLATQLNGSVPLKYNHINTGLEQTDPRRAAAGVIGRVTRAVQISDGSVYVEGYLRCGRDRHGRLRAAANFLRDEIIAQRITGLSLGHRATILANALGETRVEKEPIEVSLVEEPDRFACHIVRYMDERELPHRAAAMRTADPFALAHVANAASTPAEVDAGVQKLGVTSVHTQLGANTAGTSHSPSRLRQLVADLQHAMSADTPAAAAAPVEAPANPLASLGLKRADGSPFDPANCTYEDMMEVAKRMDDKTLKELASNNEAGMLLWAASMKALSSARPLVETGRQAMQQQRDAIKQQVGNLRDQVLQNMLESGVAQDDPRAAAVRSHFDGMIASADKGDLSKLNEMAKVEEAIFCHGSSDAMRRRTEEAERRAAEAERILQQNKVQTAHTRVLDAIRPAVVAATAPYVPPTPIAHTTQPEQPASKRQALEQPAAPVEDAAAAPAWMDLLNSSDLRASVFSTMVGAPRSNFEN